MLIFALVMKWNALHKTRKYYKSPIKEARSTTKAELMGFYF